MSSMQQERRKPAACETMEQVRFGIDRLDEQIVKLLAERFRYMEAAARIKPNRTAVRDDARKAQVIGNVLRLADDANIPRAAIETIYECLVEASICYELERFDATRT